MLVLLCTCFSLVGEISFILKSAFFSCFDSYSSSSYILITLNRFLPALVLCCKRCLVDMLLADCSFFAIPLLAIRGKSKFRIYYANNINQSASACLLISCSFFFCECTLFRWITCVSMKNFRLLLVDKILSWLCLSFQFRLRMRDFSWIYNFSLAFGFAFKKEHICFYFTYFNKSKQK